MVSNFVCNKEKSVHCDSCKRRLACSISVKCDKGSKERKKCLCQVIARIIVVWFSRSRNPYRSGNHHHLHIVAEQGATDRKEVLVLTRSREVIRGDEKHHR